MPHILVANVARISTHFEDKIQEQVRLWGFPPTCASLMTTANNYFVMADHCKQIFSDSWPLQISILMADKYFLDGWPPKIYFMADHCKYSYWWLTSTDTDIEIGPMHVFTLKADKGKYLYWWLIATGYPLQTNTFLVADHCKYYFIADHCIYL